MYDLFADFFNSFDVVPVYREDRRCENCGRTYYEFQKSGKLGCSECYKAFEPQVKQALYKMQKGTEHKGKIPSKSFRFFATSFGGRVDLVSEYARCIFLDIFRAYKLTKPILYATIKLSIIITTSGYLTKEILL